MEDSDYTEIILYIINLLDILGILLMNFGLIKVFENFGKYILIF